MHGAPGFVADGLQKTQAGLFKLEGQRVDCARLGPEYPRGGRGLAGSRTLPRLAESDAAGWEPEPWGGRGSLAARPSFQVSLGPEASSGAGAAGVRVGSRGASEGGRSRTLYPGPGLDTLSGWEPALQEEVLDRSWAHFLRPD